MEGNHLAQDFIVPPSVNLTKLLSRSVISCSTVIAERELFLKHKFKQEYYHEDFVLWIDMLKDCKISFGHTEVLAKLRIMRDSRSGNKVNSAKQRWIVYREYLNLDPVSSLYHYLIYIFLGLKKYWRLRKVL
jgi:teichuronic acid biosynthesis glycosyltransferase TuaG